MREATRSGLSEFEHEDHFGRIASKNGASLGLPFTFPKAAYLGIIVKGNKGVDVVAWLDVEDPGRVAVRSNEGSWTRTWHRTGSSGRNDNG